MQGRNQQPSLGDDESFQDFNNISHLSNNYNNDEPNLTVDDDDGFTEYTEGASLYTADQSVPDVMLLNLYCARAKAPKDVNNATEEELRQAEASWQPVRQWLSTHTAEEVKAAAEQRGENGLTALHFACRNVPPLDVLDVFLSIAGDTVSWPDGFGWWPIHYACASGSDPRVIAALAKHSPESQTATDGRGRTPLHFALGDKPAPPNIIYLLASNGAASYPDDIGMLPLHYACAFGASEDVLYVLTDAYPDAIRARDSRQRTPLHFALSNAKCKTIPAAVRLLLSLDPSIVNAVAGGPLPLRVLAEYASTLRLNPDDADYAERHDSIYRCLEHLLQADPDPTADFFTALQSLPDWLSERAVVLPAVQMLLNEKIAQRFPTAVLMMDFYVLIAIIISYSLNVADSINRRFDEIPGNDAIEAKMLIPLYLGSGYFIFREIIQIVSLISLKVFKLWLHDASNYLNVLFVALVLNWTIIMQLGSADRDIFRIGAAVSVTILWVKLLAYLRNMLIDFAVFVGGVFYVVRRLAAFLVSLVVILIAFAQMFYTIFQQSETCRNQPNDTRDYELILEETRCDANLQQPYCSFWNSFLNVYTMLLGEVSEDRFEGNGVATAFFILFMFLVVILLANVLIAIVTENYKVIQDQKAAQVFWKNRLDFVAEMDAIANGPWKSRMKQWMGVSNDENDDRNHPSGHATESDFGRDLWKPLMELFEEDMWVDGVFSFDFVASMVLRLVAAMLIIPFWFLLGILTAGWFWPPQLRKRIFTSAVLQHTSDAEKEAALRRTQVKLLQQEVIELRDELLQELALDRMQMVQMKSQVAERKMEIANEMKQIKRLVTMLFERQASFRS